MITANRVEITKELLFAVVGLVIGATLWLVTLEGYRPELSRLIIFCYEKVGITIIVLVPLLIWAVKIAVHNKDDELALAYIGDQAKEIGFLGTMIGVMIMFTALSVSLKEGQSDSIRQAIGGFSQAAISTALGLVISSFCKHVRFNSIRRNMGNLVGTQHE